MRSLKTLTPVVSLFVLFFSTACDFRFGAKTPNPALATALVNVSANYLKHVTNADEAKLGNSLLWHDFLKINSLTKEAYMQKCRALQKRYGITPQHPLIGLEVIDLVWREDKAQIWLRKRGDASAEPIYIELLWGSNSWLVLDDNLFAQGELIEQWLQED